MASAASKTRLAVLLACVLAITLAATVAPASANTNVLMMPDRQALVGTAIVVWGNSKLPNTAACTIDFGDATPVANCNGFDRSYIATTHAYAAAGTYTATLTVNGESESATVTVLDPALLNDAAYRGVRINMAIEDGLRYLYTQQFNRAANFTGAQTRWYESGDRDFTVSITSLVTLAFQNHGHSVLADPTKSIYQAVVQRGLNFLFDNLYLLTIGAETHGPPGDYGTPSPAATDTACGVGVPIDGNECKALGRSLSAGHSMYASAVSLLAIAGSGAPTRTVDAGLGANSAGFVAGRTYADILQRQANAIAWGLMDGSTTCYNMANAACRGGFSYTLDGSLNYFYADGSTAGWGVLALLDAEAAGATLPSWARDEVRFYLDSGLNADSTLKYQVYMGANQSNFPKTGIGLQVMKFVNLLNTDSRVQNAVGKLGATWAGGFSTDGFAGGNKGLAYGMFNAFKALKLYGISILPGVNRPATIFGRPRVGDPDDWHADYQEWLVLNQGLPGSTGGGYWNFGFSCCFNDAAAVTAISELILAPVALVLPANLTLSPPEATNNLALGDTQHTLVAHATATNGTPVQGATVTFTALTGPHAGVLGTAITDSNGDATFTYTGSLPGTDTIRANIGNLTSNTVTKTWITNQPPLAQCQDVTVSADAACKGTATTAQVDAGSTDPDNDPLAMSLAPAGPYSLGPNAVTLNVDDGQGHTAMCQATVTVVDTTAPAVTCPAGQTVAADAACKASVTVTATATDNCSVGSVSCGPGGPYGLGANTVSCTATDGSGNTATCDTVVTVVDQTPPQITCPAAQTVECTSPAGASVTVAAPTAADNCSVGSATCTPSSGTFALGTTPVACSATDGSGNSSSCQTTVKVVDTTAPTVSCVLVTRPKGHDHDDEGDESRGLYQVSASDVCSQVTLTLGGYTLTSGETIRLRSSKKPGVKLYAGKDDDDDDRDEPRFKRFRVGPGENVIRATDAAGNVGTVACPLPPKKGRGHDDDRPKGNNGVGNGEDPQPRGNPPVNDGPGTSPGKPGNRRS